MTEVMKLVSPFEFELAPTQERIWIKLVEPGGKRAADLGILVTDEGFSLDVWPHAGEYDGPTLSPYMFWEDLDD